MYTSNACRQGNKTCTSLIIAALGLLLAHGAVAQYSGGTGEPDTSYLIATVQDLLDLSNPANSADWNKHFRMPQDIDMDGETGFKPIGFDWENPFTGVFDGDGHVIRNLVINLPDWDHAGWYTATQLSGDKDEPVTASFYLNVVEAMPLYGWGLVALVAAVAVTATAGRRKLTQILESWRARHANATTGRSGV